MRNLALLSWTLCIIATKVLKDAASPKRSQSLPAGGAFRRVFSAAKKALVDASLLRWTE